MGIQREGDSKTRYLDLGQDLEALEDLLTREDARLLIMDPLSAYMPHTDSFKESEVRQVLAPLGELAQRCGTSIVVIMHLNKRAEVGNALYRGIGSVGFLAAARTVHSVVVDKQDPELRQFMPVKSNVGPRVSALSYRIVDAMHPLGFTVGRVQWEGESGATAEEYFGAIEDAEGRSRVDDAFDFLTNLLESQDGAYPERAVQLAAKISGVSPSALQKAKTRAGIHSKKRGKTEWWWLLPGRTE